MGIMEVSKIPADYRRRRCKCGEWTTHFVGRRKFCYECAKKRKALFQDKCPVCGCIFDKRVPSRTGLCKSCKKDFMPDYIRVQQNNKRTKDLGLRGDLTLQEWFEILKLYDNKCFYCGDQYAALDHVIPVSKGGGTFKENVVPCCKKCNSSKRDKII